MLVPAVAKQAYELWTHRTLRSVHRTWVNEPEKAAAISEAITRDADHPEDATSEVVAPPPPSRLVQETLGAAKASANGVASGLAKLSVGRPAAANGARAVAAATS